MRRSEDGWKELEVLLIDVARRRKSDVTILLRSGRPVTRLISTSSASVDKTMPATGADHVTTATLTTPTLDDTEVEGGKQGDIQ